MAAGSVLGDYRIESVLGRGGMGIVYRAEQLSLGRPVALKVIATGLAPEEGFRERFARESRLAASLDHPHVVPVYAAGEHEGVLYIAMRLVDGVDLRALLALEGPLEPKRASRITGQVASALEAAHERGLVHRDVKPANVLIAGREGVEHAYLTDFGLVKRTASASGLTAAGQWVGTLDYVAPEQLRGDAVDGRADIYSLGCLLFETLTGRVPFPRDNELAKLWAHISDPPPDASALALNVAPELAAVAQRAMAKRPEHRYGSAAEFRAALEPGHPGQTEAPTKPRQASAAERPVDSGLPAPLTPIVGREDDTRSVAELLRRDDVRLVTLTGPGGVGKTRLALETASIVLPDFRDGAWFVSLAATATADLVPSAIAQALPLTMLPGELPEEALQRFLGDKQGLLVLDNLEHVAEAAPFVSELLAGSATAKVLATSRTPLRVRPEHCYAVAPLSLPTDDEPATIEDAAASALFLERIRSQSPAFRLTEHNAEAIASICRSLDGLPLAIELAAARTRLLDPSELKARLGHALSALGSGARDAPARQRTLRATIEWSHRLLTDREARAFARLAVFAGGATIDAAELVADADLETLEGLVDQQLLTLQRDPGVGGARVGMLETIREYASERLDEDADSSEVRRRHCLHFLALAEKAQPHFFTQAEADWLLRLDIEAGNLRAAFEWGLSNRPPLALRLAGFLGERWERRGNPAEGLQWLGAALDVAGDAAPIADRARARRARVDLMAAAGASYDWQGSREAAEAEALEAVALSREAGDPAGIALALLAQANLYVADSLPQPRRLALADEALAYARDAGDDSLVALSLAATARALPPEQATAEIEEAAAALTAIGDWRVISLFADIGYNAIKRGNPKQARQLLDQALPLARSLGDPHVLAYVWGNIGMEALFNGDFDRARKAFEEQIRLARAHSLWVVAESFCGLAALETRRADLRRAARLLGAASATGPWDTDADVTRQLEQQFFAPARAAYGEKRWNHDQAAGAQLTLEEAVDLALTEA